MNVDYVCRAFVVCAVLCVMLPFSQQTKVTVPVTGCHAIGCTINGTVKCQQDNITGNYTCGCYPGYQGETCVDRNECSSGHQLCGDNGMCINILGGFRCDCLPGLTGDHCRKNDTSNKCTVGYKGDGLNCTDVNECILSSVNPCGHGTCINTVGSFKCACPSGWTGNRCKTEIDECASSPCQNGNCTDQVGSFYCICSHYWTGNLCDVSVSTTAKTGSTDHTTSLRNTISVERTVESTHITKRSSIVAVLHDTTPGHHENPTNIGLIAGCVAAGIIAISGCAAVAILLYHFVIKRRHEVNTDPDTVIEVEQAATSTTNTEKNGRTVVGIPMDNPEYAMKTRFSIQRLLR